MKTINLLLLCTLLVAFGCKTTGSYQTISATETIVLNANAAYLDAVVSGKVPTNSVPQVEQAFNETQMVLHAAVVTAQGNSSAQVPPDAAGTASAFTNRVYTILRK